MHTLRAQHSSWQDVLRSPARPAHIVQICDSDEVLVDGAAYFAAEGLEGGEAVILTGTQEHMHGIRRALRSRGVSAEACERRGQLVFTDAEEAVRHVLEGGEPDRARGGGRPRRRAPPQLRPRPRRGKLAAPRGVI